MTLYSLLLFISNNIHAILQMFVEPLMNVLVHQSSVYSIFD